MPFTETCHLCGRDTLFSDEEAPDDDEPESAGLLLCETCQGVWNEVRIVNDIMFGNFDPPMPEEQEQ